MKNYLSEEFFDLTKQLLRKMRTTCLLILVFASSLFATNVNSQVAKVSLSIKNSNLIKVLDAIENQTDYLFVYNKNEIDLNREINLDVKDQSVATVLSGIFQSTGMSYAMEGNNIVLFNKVGNVQQQKTVTGKVIDSTNEGLPGVSVVVKGTTVGTITDFDGNYSLSNIPANATLQFSFVGMKSQDIVVGNQTSINVSLADESIGIEEVVAVGYGVQKKSVVTGAISSVKAEDIKSSSNTRPEQALQGKTSGVQIVSSSGAPGSAMKIRIRGYSSNGNSDPLYIVDGVRTNDISGLEPSNIASMEVLKDGASAAIYGAEGGNGVILITTKNGSAGKSEISYDFQYTIQSLGRTPKLMNAQQYIGYMSESGANKSLVADGTDTDWIGESFEASPMQKHNVTITGGSDKTTYLGSISYLDQEGIVKGDKDNYKRYSGMFNGSQKVNDWLKFGDSFQFSRSVKNSFNENDEYRGVIANALLIDPLTPVEYLGAVPAHVQSLIDAGRPVMKNDNGNYFGISRYVNGETINPFVQNRQSQSETTITNIMGNIYMDITPMKGLTFTSKLGLNYIASNVHNYKPLYYYSAEMNNTAASISESVGSMTYWQWENYASYVKSIDKHNFTIMAGTSISSNEYKTVNASGFPLLKDMESYADLDYISTQSNSKVSGTTLTDNKMSYFARANYDYNNKYLFQLTVRRDAAGLSILPKDNRWGVFPSLSAGWVTSSEDFFPKSDVLTYMKVRGSWGQNGSLSNLGSYSYAANILSSGLLLNTLSWSNVNASYSYPLANGSYATASAPTVLGNKDLTWETSEQLDLGVDFRFFKSKMGFTADYYRKTTRDLITTNTPPLEAGNNASPINGGDVLNKGFDFELSWRSQVGNLKYNISTNLSTLKNEVTYLDPTISRINGANVNTWTSATAFEKGMPVWYFRGYKTNGINPTTGDINIVDINNDGAINNNDFTNIGSAIPDITYGATLNLEYKGFDFTVFLQGQSGNDVLMGIIRTDRPATNKLAIFYEDRWTPTNTTASRPSASVSPRYWNSDQMIFDGSFTKIKQIQLGYNLPKTITERLHIGRTRIYGTLDDCFIFTKYPGMDPEAASTVNNSIGIDRGFFPISKKVLFGLSLSF